LDLGDKSYKSHSSRVLKRGKKIEPNSQYSMAKWEFIAKDRVGVRRWKTSRKTHKRDSSYTDLTGLLPNTHQGVQTSSGAWWRWKRN
jgi:hypothetical protein